MKILSLRGLAAVLIAVGVTMPAAFAAPKPQAAMLTPVDRADVQRIEAYLNGMRSVSGHFLQTSDNGGVQRGAVYFQRPGKMRFEYEPPSPILMVSTGNFLVYHDSFLKQTSYLPIGSTPLSIFVKDQMKLSGDLTLTRFERSADTLRVTVQQTADPDQGSLTLVFSDQPLALRQWVVLDQQNIATRVSLVDLTTDAKLNPELFQYNEVPGATGR